MQIGSSSAPSALKKMMILVVTGILGVAVYMGNIMFHGPDRKTPDECLDQVFQRLACHHFILTVSSEKCVFGMAEVFVDRCLSRRGVAPLLSIVGSILHLWSPSLLELNSCMGVTNYYLCLWVASLGCLSHSTITEVRNAISGGSRGGSGGSVEPRSVSKMQNIRDNPDDADRAQLEL